MLRGTEHLCSQPAFCLSQVSQELEEAVCSLTKLEHAFFSCPVRPSATGSRHSVPAPPKGLERVEYELTLLQYAPGEPLVRLPNALHRVPVLSLGSFCFYRLRRSLFFFHLKRLLQPQSTYSPHS